MTLLLIMSAMQEYVDEVQNVLDSKGFEYEYCVSQVNVPLSMSAFVTSGKVKLAVTTTSVLSICSLLIRHSDAY